MGTKPSNVFTGPPTNNSPDCGTGYTVEVVNGIPTVVFDSAVAAGKSVHIRPLMGTVVTALSPGSVFTDTIYDGSVTPVKMDFGAGLDNRVVVVNSLGVPAATTFTVSLISDWTAQLEALPLSTFNPAEDNIDLQGNKLINVADGTASTDAVNKGQLDSVVASLAVSYHLDVYVYPGLSSGTHTITGYNNQPFDILQISIDYGDGFYMRNGPTILAASEMSVPARIDYADHTGARVGYLTITRTATGMTVTRTHLVGSTDPNVKFVYIINS